MAYTQKKYIFSNKIAQPNYLMQVVWLLFFCGLLWPMQGASQNAYTVGTQFTMAYSDVIKWNWGGGQPSDTISQVELRLLGANAACVRVRVNELGFDHVYDVPLDSAVRVVLPQLPFVPYGTVRNNAIMVDATAPIGVLLCTNPGGGGQSGQNGYAGLAEVSAQVPDQNLEAVAIAAGQTDLFSSKYVGLSPGTIVSLCSAEDTNIIEVKLNASGISGLSSTSDSLLFFADSTYLLELNRNESFSYFIFAHTDDPKPIPGPFFNGSYFQSLNNKNLNIQVVPIQAVCLDDLALRPRAPTQEQPLPLPYFGTSFHALPIESYSKNMYSIMAAKDSTVVSINGVNVAVVDSLKYIDTCFAGAAVIETNHPVEIYYTGCPNRYTNDNALSHFSMTLSGDHQLQNRSLFCTVDEPDTINNYVLGVVTPTSATAQFLLDGAAVGSATFSPFVHDSSWSWANIPLQKGTHIAQSAAGFHGIQYTWYSDGIPDNLGVVNYPAYGYVLPESKTWPADSFVFKAGISPQQLLPFAQAQPEICAGDALFFQASHQRHTTWHWQFGDGTDTLIKVENKKTKPFAHTFAQPGQYWVTVQDSAGCAPGDSLLVEVLPNPAATFLATSTASCTGTFVQLQNQSTGAQEYFWQWPNGSSTAQNPNFQYAGNETEIEITLIAKSENCSDTATQTFNIELLTFNPRSVPNIITPNNDGRNDAFCIPDVAGFAECFDLQIFNRWGQAVFSTQNPQDCWRGQFQNRPAADGVYFYVLQLAGQTYQGEVTVMGGG